MPEAAQALTSVMPVMEGAPGVLLASAPGVPVLLVVQAPLTA